MNFTIANVLRLLVCLGILAFAPVMIGDVVLASSNKDTIKASPDSDCALTYAAFEASIPHIDLKQCPGGDSSDKVFCRAKTGHDEIVVFKFSTKGDQCLVNTKSYDDEHFNLTIFDLVIKAD